MNTEELKKVIQAANDDIMKLQFGCEVEYQLYGKQKPRKAIVLDSDEQDVNFVSGGGCSVHGIKKILGRPIRLADVLLAVNDLEDGDLFGAKRAKWWNDKVKDVVQVWDLHDDSLDAQSDETKQFLIDLLVK